MKKIGKSKSVISLILMTMLALSFIPIQKNLTVDSNTSVVGAVNSVTANPSTHKVYVDGINKNVAAYNIGGNNYFKLRDIAAVVNGTPKQFEVTWDAGKKAINLVSGKPYTTVGGELAAIPSGTVSAASSTASVYKDVNLMSYTGYNIANNNYYKLRDVAESFDIGIKWDGANHRMDILTDKSYGKEDEDTDTSATPTEPVMKTVSNNPGYSYDTSLLNIPDGDERGKKYQNNPELMIRTWELAMVDYVNEERRKAGVNELVIDDDIMGFSHHWAEHMAVNNDLKHSDWDDGREYAKSIGLSEEESIKVINVGENIGKQSGGIYRENSPKEFVEMFMNSKGHRIAMLRSDFKTIGIGVAVSSDGSAYCCQNFGH